VLLARSAREPLLEPVLELTHSPRRLKSGTVGVRSAARELASIAHEPFAPWPTCALALPRLFAKSTTCGSLGALPALGQVSLWKSESSPTSAKLAHGVVGRILCGGMSRAGVVLGLVVLVFACSGRSEHGGGSDSSAGGSGSVSGAPGSGGEAGVDGEGGEPSVGSGGSKSGGRGGSGGGGGKGGRSGGAGGSPSPECEAGDERPGETSCGLNGRGRFIEECVDSHFRESARCDDPDECVDGEAKWGKLCDDGTERHTCVEGAWLVECVDAWRVTFGTTKNDVVKAFELDADGSGYVVGLTTGDFDGVNAGYDDAFLAKLDAEGQLLWVKQWGTTTPDSAQDVARAEDALFVIGNTDSDLTGSAADSASTDAFLRKMDGDGNELWTKQWGTFEVEAGLGVFTHGDCLYAVGRSEGALGAANYGGSDAWARRVDPETGDVVWTVQFGSDAYDQASRGTTDSAGDVIVVGYTGGALGVEPSSGGLDAFVRKLASDAGVELWTKQFGTSGDDAAVGVIVDADDDVIVIGTTTGALPGCEHAGGVDAFLVKLDGLSGEVTLEAQWGTDGDDVPWAVARDAAGTYYVVGSTSGDLAAEAAGWRDAFVTKLDATGQVLWSEQWGTLNEDVAAGLGLDTSQSIYIAGFTEGALAGPGLGEADIFLQHFPAR
jgi:hypothetical protein